MRDVMEVGPRNQIVRLIFRYARLSLQSDLFLLVLPATKTSTTEVDPGDVRVVSQDAKFAYSHATNSSDLLFLHTTASI